MRRPTLALLAALAALAAAPALAADPTPAPAGRTPAPKGAYCYIGWPNDGETVRSPFKVWFGLRGMGVAPAGVEKPNTGHHHLIVDADLPPPDQPIPNNKNYLHFGGGQTETTLDLPPGRHTLQLLLGDDKHVPFDPPVMSKKITITVAQP
ncbi:MAG: DUF4399 domain-containing protein [Geminicoccaceae bacterium]|jgi:uncharacterized protein DUF4399